MILMPPRHGKSVLVSRYFPAWYLGTFPDRKVILASYEATFAEGWGRQARNVMEEYGPSLWGLTVKPEAARQAWWELAGHEGAMYSVGAGGPLTGKGAELVIVDDLVKNSEEAMSELAREKTFEWYRMTLRSRLHDGGAIVVIATRWHEDDVIGRLLQEAETGGDRWEVLRLPALAEEEDPLGRSPGEALCPELFRRETLEETKRAVGEWIFATQYQQTPFAKDGGFFRMSEIEIVKEIPNPETVVRAWDLAATVDGDYTAGVKVARGPDLNFYVVDVVRGRWAPAERDRIILQTAERDGRYVTQRFAEDPGSAGKAQTEALQKLLVGHVARFEKITGDKVVRAAPVASVALRLKVLQAPWAKRFLSELEAFPNGKHDDQVDALSDAFEALKRARWLVEWAKEGESRQTLIDRGVNVGDDDAPPDPLAGWKPAGFANERAAFDDFRGRREP